MVDARRLAAWCCAASIMMTAAGCAGDQPRAEGATAQPTTTTSAAAEPQRGQVDRAPVGSGPLVVVLGDSLTVQSRTHLERALADHSTMIAGLGGEGWAGGPYTSGFDQTTPVLVRTAVEYAGRRPVAAVVAIGTNDAWKPDLDGLAALGQIDATVRSLGEACLVAVEVDPDIDDPDFDRGEADAINDRLRAVADEVVPWDRMTDEQPEILSDDGIHLSEHGRTVRSEAIADAVRRCTEGG
jgi:lysophospholipase L1-like esterase